MRVYVFGIHFVTNRSGLNRLQTSERYFFHLSSSRSVHNVSNYRISLLEFSYVRIMIGSVMEFPGGGGNSLEDTIISIIKTCTHNKLITPGHGFNRLFVRR